MTWRAVTPITTSNATMGGRKCQEAGTTYEIWPWSQSFSAPHSEPRLCNVPHWRKAIQGAGRPRQRCQPELATLASRLSTAKSMSSAAQVFIRTFCPHLPIWVQEHGDRQSTTNMILLQIRMTDRLGPDTIG